MNVVSAVNLKIPASLYKRHTLRVFYLHAVSRDGRAWSCSNLLPQRSYFPLLLAGFPRAWAPGASPLVAASSISGSFLPGIQLYLNSFSS